jgi:chromosome segregation ATPase
MSHLESNNKQHLMQINEYTARIQQAETEKEAMLTQLDEAKNKRESDADAQSRELRDASRKGEEAKAQTAFATEQKNAAEEQVRQSAQKIVGLQEELDRLRRQIQDLQQQSADNEVKRVQMSKQREKDMEDISGLNMALDSKQQELELVGFYLLVVAFLRADKRTDETQTRDEGYCCKYSSTQAVSASRIYNFCCDTGCFCSSSLSSL